MKTVTQQSKVKAEFESLAAACIIRGISFKYYLREQDPGWPSRWCIEIMLTTFTHFECAIYDHEVDTIFFLDKDGEDCRIQDSMKMLENVMKFQA